MPIAIHGFDRVQMLILIPRPHILLPSHYFAFPQAVVLPYSIHDWDPVQRFDHLQQEYDSYRL